MAMLVTSLAACGKGDGSETDTGETESEIVTTVDADALDYPQSGDFGGRSFRVMQRRNFLYEFDAEGYNGSVVNDAVYERNTAIETRYNVDITTKSYYHTWQNTEFATMLGSLMGANEDAFDLISGYQYYTVPTILNGWYYDWNDVPYVNLEHKIWQNGVNDVMTINGNTYAITGDLAITFWKHMSVMVFNKQMMLDIGETDLYGVVKDGDWTFEYMKQISAKATSETDEIYGFASDNDVAIDSFKEAFDVPVVQRDLQGNLYFTVATEKSDKVVKALVDFYKSGVGYTYPGEDPSYKFKAGQAMIVPMRFEMVERLRGSDMNYGIVPYPKWDKAQTNYGTTVCDGVSLFYVPFTAPDLEFIGTITMALADKNWTHVIPEYYSLVIEAKGTKDEESIEMLNIIRTTVVSDFGYIYSGSLGGAGHVFRQAVQSEGNSNIYTLWEKAEPNSTSKLKTLLDFYQNQ